MSPSGAGRHQYVIRCAQAGECEHGHPGGLVCRPTTGTPACALCRRLHPAARWIELWPAEPLPRNVTPINSRRLF